MIVLQVYFMGLPIQSFHPLVPIARLRTRLIETPFRLVTNPSSFDLPGIRVTGQFYAVSEYCATILYMDMQRSCNA